MVRRAWLALTASLAIHVWDEAAHDFLAVYNPTAERIQQYTYFPFPPTFSFGAWLTGLIAAMVVLAVISAWAPLWAAYPYAILMILNGLGHVAGSIYMSRLMAGIYSAPLLLASGVWLLAAAVAVSRHRRRLSGGPHTLGTLGITPRGRS